MITDLLYYIQPGHNPYENLATEEYLRRQAHEGELILYLWQNESTVVIGRNQNAAAECDIPRLEGEGGHLARRFSGGGAVYHDLGNVNFSFLVCQSDEDVKRQTSILLEGVRALGIEAQATGRNDLTADGRKFSGNAYYRSGGKCCHHGTVMLDVDAARLGRYLIPSPAKLAKRGVPSVRSRVINLRELAPHLTVEELNEQIIAAAGRVYGLEPRPLPRGRLESRERDEIASLLASEKWRLGSQSQRQHTAHGLFSWGEVTVSFDLDGGIFKNVALYSDGLEALLLAHIPELLEGRTLEGLTSPGPLTDREKEIFNDITGLLRPFSERKDIL